MSAEEEESKSNINIPNNNPNDTSNKEVRISSYYKPIEEKQKQEFLEMKKLYLIQAGQQYQVQKYRSNFLLRTARQLKDELHLAPSSQGKPATIVIMSQYHLVPEKKLIHSPQKLNVPQIFENSKLIIHDFSEDKLISWKEIKSTIRIIMLPKREINRYLTPAGKIDIPLIKPHLEKIYVVYMENLSQLHKFLNFSLIFNKRQLFMSESNDMLFKKIGANMRSQFSVAFKNKFILWVQSEHKRKKEEEKVVLENQIMEQQRRINELEFIQEQQRINEIKFKEEQQRINEAAKEDELLQQKQREQELLKESQQIIVAQDNKEISQIIPEDKPMYYLQQNSIFDSTSQIKNNDNNNLGINSMLMGDNKLNNIQANVDAQMLNNPAIDSATAVTQQPNGIITSSQINQPPLTGASDQNGIQAATLNQPSSNTILSSNTTGLVQQPVPTNNNAILNQQKLLPESIPAVTNNHPVSAQYSLPQDNNTIPIQSSSNTKNITILEQTVPLQVELEQIQKQPQLQYNQQQKDILPINSAHIKAPEQSQEFLPSTSLINPSDISNQLDSSQQQQLQGYSSQHNMYKGLLACTNIENTTITTNNPSILNVPSADTNINQNLQPYKLTNDKLDDIQEMSTLEQEGEYYQFHMDSNKNNKQQQYQQMSQRLLNNSSEIKSQESLNMNKLALNDNYAMSKQQQQFINPNNAQIEQMRRIYAGQEQIRKEQSTSSADNAGQNYNNNRKGNNNPIEQVHMYDQLDSPMIRITQVSPRQIEQQQTYQPEYKFIPPKKFQPMQGKNAQVQSSSQQNKSWNQQNNNISQGIQKSYDPQQQQQQSRYDFKEICNQPIRNQSQLLRQMSAQKSLEVLSSSPQSSSQDIKYLRQVSQQKIDKKSDKSEQLSYQQQQTYYYYPQEDQHNNQQQSSAAYNLQQLNNNNINSLQMQQSILNDSGTWRQRNSSQNLYPQQQQHQTSIFQLGLSTIRKSNENNPHNNLNFNNNNSNSGFQIFSENLLSDDRARSNSYAFFPQGQNNQIDGYLAGGTVNNALPKDAFLLSGLSARNGKDRQNQLIITSSSEDSSNSMSPERQQNQQQNKTNRTLASPHSKIVNPNLTGLIFYWKIAQLKLFDSESVNHVQFGDIQMKIIRKMKHPRSDETWIAQIISWIPVLSSTDTRIACINKNGVEIVSTTFNLALKHKYSRLGTQAFFMLHSEEEQFIQARSVHCVAQLVVDYADQKEEWLERNQNRIKNQQKNNIETNEEIGIVSPFMKSQQEVIRSQDLFIYELIPNKIVQFPRSHIIDYFMNDPENNNLNNQDIMKQQQIINNKSNSNYKNNSNSLILNKDISKGLKEGISNNSNQSLQIPFSLEKFQQKLTRIADNRVQRILSWEGKMKAETLESALKKEHLEMILALDMNAINSQFFKLFQSGIPQMYRLSLYGKVVGVETLEINLRNQLKDVFGDSNSREQIQQYQQLQPNNSRINQFEGVVSKMHIECKRFCNSQILTLDSLLRQIFPDYNNSNQIPQNQLESPKDKGTSKSLSESDDLKRLALIKHQKDIHDKMSYYGRAYLLYNQLISDMLLDVPISEGILLILKNFCEHFIIEEQHLNLGMIMNNDRQNQIQLNYQQQQDIFENLLFFSFIGVVKLIKTIEKEFVVWASIEQILLMWPCLNNQRLFIIQLIELGISCLYANILIGELWNRLVDFAMLGEYNDMNFLMIALSVSVFQVFMEAENKRFFEFGYNDEISHRESLEEIDMSFLEIKIKEFYCLFLDSCEEFIEILKQNYEIIVNSKKKDVLAGYTLFLQKIKGTRITQTNGNYGKIIQPMPFSMQIAEKLKEQQLNIQEMQLMQQYQGLKEVQKSNIRDTNSNFEVNFSQIEAFVFLNDLDQSFFTSKQEISLEIIDKNQQRLSINNNELSELLSPPGQNSNIKANQGTIITKTINTASKIKSTANSSCQVIQLGNDNQKTKTSLHVILPTNLGSYSKINLGIKEESILEIQLRSIGQDDNYQQQQQSSSNKQVYVGRMVLQRGVSFFTKFNMRLYLEIAAESEKQPREVAIDEYIQIQIYLETQNNINKSNSLNQNKFNSQSPFLSSPEAPPIVVCNNSGIRIQNYDYCTRELISLWSSIDPLLFSPTNEEPINIWISQMISRVSSDIESSFQEKIHSLFENLQAGSGEYLVPLKMTLLLQAEMLRMRNILVDFKQLLRKAEQSLNLPIVRKFNVSVIFQESQSTKNSQIKEQSNIQSDGQVQFFQNNYKQLLENSLFEGVEIIDIRSLILEFHQTLQKQNIKFNNQLPYSSYNLSVSDQFHNGINVTVNNSGMLAISPLEQQAGVCITKIRIFNNIRLDLEQFQQLLNFPDSFLQYPDYQQYFFTTLVPLSLTLVQQNTSQHNTIILNNTSYSILDTPYQIVVSSQIAAGISQNNLNQYNFKVFHNENELNIHSSLVSQQSISLQLRETISQQRSSGSFNLTLQLFINKKINNNNTNINNTSPSQPNPCINNNIRNSLQNKSIQQNSFPCVLLLPQETQQTSCLLLTKYPDNLNYQYFSAGINTVFKIPPSLVYQL